MVTYFIIYSRKRAGLTACVFCVSCGATDLGWVCENLFLVRPAEEEEEITNDPVGAGIQVQATIEVRGHCPSNMFTSHDVIVRLAQPITNWDVNIHDKGNSLKKKSLIIAANEI